jgi:hypothetical protein
MLAKLFVTNQPTSPKPVIQQVDSAAYVEVKVQRVDAVRAKLAALDITEEIIAHAVDWARQA